MSIDLDKPRYDQSTYIGRAKHFLLLTNPMNAFVSDAQLEEAKKIVTEFRKSRKLPPGYDENKLWATKYLYDSAFHPDSGEKMIVLGRMSAQAPMNTLITGCMITFYKTTAATVFWQWVNQTFNAVVNYTNRSGTTPMPTSTSHHMHPKAQFTSNNAHKSSTHTHHHNLDDRFAPKPKHHQEDGGSTIFVVEPILLMMLQFRGETIVEIVVVGVCAAFVCVVAGELRLGVHVVACPACIRQLIASYCAACGGALSTALYLNSKVKNMSPIYARLVPFAAVCGANFINIPMMRSGELINGTPVSTREGVHLGDSKVAARYGIGLVCISRVFMALPGMTVTPIITNIATRKGLFCKRPMMVIPFQLFLVGLCVTFATPLCCALFEQRASIGVDSLDSELKASIKKNYPKVKEVYFNKGL